MNFRTIRKRTPNDLNDATVTYHKGKTIKKQRVVFKYCGIDKSDTNIYIMTTCEAKYINASITKDGLREWLKEAGQRKNVMSLPYYYLQNEIEQFPVEMREEFDALYKKITETQGIDFINEDQLAKIFLQGRQPVLISTRVLLKNYINIERDEFLH